ncbi:aquaporin TIP1-2-like [Tripterygium wilfordii]|uniref:Aquaporin TIP1-2-like n=1 Tax=Tripterygium wilfordii TaxID=458696 RepID=A0A7J7C146_TRIWF|nr:probable aquaporin PIP2-6 [Tripterygium wilfordii]KAF5727842.1 aquaporin TIP1-2-like [Tripterygium wilfordii]
MGSVDQGSSPDTGFLSFIGAHEFFSPELWRAAITEFVSTAFLLLTLTLAIMACLDYNDTSSKLLIPFAVFFIAFLLLIYAVPLSGGHMNPVFTFIAVLRGLITITRAIIYILAQCLGSIMGFFVIKSVMAQSEVEKYALGGCRIGGLGPGTALVVEVTSNFVVLLVGVTVGFDKRRWEELGSAMVCVVVAGSFALGVFVSTVITGRADYGGAGLNPARCLGPALWYGGPLWDGHWVFWCGPFLACIIYFGYSLTLPQKGLVLGESHIVKQIRVSCLGGNNSLEHYHGKV